MRAAQPAGAAAQPFAQVSALTDPKTPQLPKLMFNERAPGQHQHQHQHQPQPPHNSAEEDADQAEAGRPDRQGTLDPVHGHRLAVRQDLPYRHLVPVKDRRPLSISGRPRYPTTWTNVAPVLGEHIDPHPNRATRTRQALSRLRG